MGHPRTSGDRAEKVNWDVPYSPGAGQATPKESCPYEFLSGPWSFSLFESYWTIYCIKAPFTKLEDRARWWIPPALLWVWNYSDNKDCPPTLSAPHESYDILAAEGERTWVHPFSDYLCSPKLSMSLLQRGLTWCLSTAMAVRVKAETWREQYCANLLTWHIPFPKIQVLFTKRA